MWFKCVQIGKKDLVQECFYREADSEKDIFKYLNMFVWPNKGKWEVSPAGDYADEDY